MSNDEWFHARCKECGWSPGGFDGESLADSYMLGSIRKCPECGSTFQKQDGHQRWNYAVERMPRPPPDPSRITVVLKVDFSLQAAVLMMEPKVGPLVVADIEELNSVSRGGWPSATLALWGKVLDGAIKLRGLHDCWWKPEWDKLTLGEVLREKSAPAIEIEARVPKALVDRLRDKVRYLRNSGAHQKYTRVSMSEASGAVEALSDFLKVWFP